MDFVSGSPVVNRSCSKHCKQQNLEAWRTIFLSRRLGSYDYRSATQNNPSFYRVYASVVGSSRATITRTIGMSGTSDVCCWSAARAPGMAVY